MAENFEIRAYSKGELSKMYKIDHSTFRKWLKLVPGLENTKFKKIFTPLEVQKIVTHLGKP